MAEISGKKVFSDMVSEVLDEKTVGIVCITVIAVVSMFKVDDASSIVIPCITGLAGFITGKKLAEAAKKS